MPPDVIDLQELEAQLRGVPGIDAVRVVAGDDGRITEVHVIAGQSKTANQVVRDVQTVARSIFDLDIDHRVVSVVQFDTSIDLRTDGGPPTVERVARPRFTLDRIRVEHERSTVRVEVALSRDQDEATAAAVAPAVEAAIQRATAEATLSAIASLDERVGGASVDSVGMCGCGPRQLAVATVVLAEQGRRETSLFGSAVVRAAGQPDAVVRAVLDSVNRRLSW